VQQEPAQIVALRALSWLAEDADRLAQFLNASGAGAADLRTRAAEPEFLGAVLDHLLTEEAWVLAFCDASGLPRDLPLRARAALPGGSALHWT
jgi:hypothetical protein